MEAEFKGKWYAGTLMGEGWGETKGKYRWSVQCECDRVGVLTYTNRVRKRRAGSRAIVRTEDTAEEEVSMRGRRMRKLRRLTDNKGQTVAKQSREGGRSKGREEGAEAEQGAAQVQGGQADSQGNELEHRGGSREGRLGTEQRASRALRRQRESEQEEEMREINAAGKERASRALKRQRLREESECDGTRAEEHQPDKANSEQRRCRANEERDYATLVKDTG